MNEPAADVADVAPETELPLELELPDYHGRRAVGMKTKLTGAGSRISRPHAIGDRVVLVVEARAKGDGHEETDDGILYVQTLKVLDVFEVQGKPGERLISTLRQSYRVADDARGGKTALGAFGVGDDLTAAGITDGSGVAITTEELAELRGDPTRSMLSDSTTPVVVLYSDGARELWPDDFDAGIPRPAAGERFRTGGDGPVAYVYVEELLDVQTGETLAEWTREQEEARLLAGEQAAEVAELAEETAVNEPMNPDEPLSVVDESLEPLDSGLEPLEPSLPGEDEPPLADVVDFPGAAKAFVDETGEPTVEDYAFVDRNLADVVGDLPMILDLRVARRLLEAEKRGRGRNLKTRKGAVDALLARIAELELLARIAELEKGSS